MTSETQKPKDNPLLVLRSSGPTPFHINLGKPATAHTLTLVRTGYGMTSFLSMCNTSLPKQNAF